MQIWGSLIVLGTRCNTVLQDAGVKPHQEPTPEALAPYALQRFSYLRYSPKLPRPSGDYDIAALFYQGGITHPFNFPRLFGAGVPFEGAAAAPFFFAGVPLTPPNPLNLRTFGLCSSGSSSTS